MDADQCAWHRARRCAGSAPVRRRRRARPGAGAKHALRDGHAARPGAGLPAPARVRPLSTGCRGCAGEGADGTRGRAGGDTALPCQRTGADRQVREARRARVWPRAAPGSGGDGDRIELRSVGSFAEERPGSDATDPRHCSPLQGPPHHRPGAEYSRRHGLPALVDGLFRRGPHARAGCVQRWREGCRTLSRGAALRRDAPVRATHHRCHRRAALATVRPFGDAAIGHAGTAARTRRGYAEAPQPHPGPPPRPGRSDRSAGASWRSISAAKAQQRRRFRSADCRQRPSPAASPIGPGRRTSCWPCAPLSRLPDARPTHERSAPAHRRR